MRKVRISKPTKSAMQSGSGGDKWVIELQESPESRSIDGVMGWTSSKDMGGEVKLEFPDVDSATKFAQKNNWTYEIIESAARKLIKKSYANNFK